MTRVSRSDTDEYNKKLGIKKKRSRIFSFLKKFFNARKEKNKKNLFANANEVTVIQLGMGAKPSNDTANVMGLVGIDNRFSTIVNLEFSAAIFHLDMPSFFNDINSAAY